MSITLRFGGISDVGKQRQENQDSMYAGPWLVAVADGVGGAAGGEVASRLTINAMMPLDTDQIADPESALKSAANDADVSIRQTVAEHSALAGMGTTLTAMLATDDQVALAHIGDSRAYRLRGNALEQLTHDHTLVQSLIDDGQITEEEAQTHPRRSWIMRALDGRGNPDVDVLLLDVEPGDRYLVCSDGLSSYVDEIEIGRALRGDDPQSAADRLLQLALAAGGPDNITCIVADPVDDDPQSEPAILGGAVAEDPPKDLEAETADQADDETSGRDAAPRRSIGRRLAIVAAIVVILIAGAVAGIAVYIHHQWYVAPSAGKVAVFQGVHGSAAGIHLSHVHALTNIPVTALPQDDRQRVLNRIEVSGGQSGAAAVVANLRHDACTLVTPSPTPQPQSGGSATPSPKPSASPTARPTWCVTSP
jgi:serine/threonine protein phosphatase PrpC